MLFHLMARTVHETNQSFVFSHCSGFRSRVPFLPPFVHYHRNVNIPRATQESRKCTGAAVAAGAPPEPTVISKGLPPPLPPLLFAPPDLAVEVLVDVVLASELLTVLESESEVMVEVAEVMEDTTVVDDDCPSVVPDPVAVVVDEESVVLSAAVALPDAEAAEVSAALDAEEAAEVMAAEVPVVTAAGLFVPPVEEL